MSRSTLRDTWKYTNIGTIPRPEAYPEKDRQVYAVTVHRELVTPPDK